MGLAIRVQSGKGFLEFVLRQSSGVVLQNRLPFTAPIGYLLSCCISFSVFLCSGLAWSSAVVAEQPGKARLARGPVSTTSRATAGVEVVVDCTQGLNLGGSRQLRRDAYFNIHGTPGELSRQEADYLLGTLRASMGRSMGAITSFMAGLKEDPQRPGFAEPKDLEQRAEEFAARMKSRPQHYQDSLAIVHSVHPYSYYGKQGEKKPHFVPGTHEAAAEILSAFFSQLDLLHQPYFEVANEGNVHVRELGTSMEDLSELHSTMARRLHQEVPGLKIGGPAAAWPAFEVKDFRIWRDQMGLFIDRAGKDMDFLSVHLYTTHYDDQVNNRFGANIDAILDLMESKSLLSTGEVKPLLISECGTGLKKGEEIMDKYSPHRDWLILRGANHVFMNLLRRDSRIIKVIPFLVLKASWYKADHPYPWTLFHRQGNEWVPTHLSKWYEFWRDVQGRHLPTACSSLDVQAHAVLDGRTVYVLLDNMLDEKVVVNVKKLLGEDLRVQSASISRFYFDGKQPTIEPDSLSSDGNHRLTLLPHQATILKFGLNESPRIDSEELETTLYADRILLPIREKPVYFRVESPVEKGRAVSAVLRIGVGRAKHLAMQPFVRFNGKTLEAFGNLRGESSLLGDESFFTKEVSVPAELLRKTNRVAVQFPDAGGHVSSVVLVVRQQQQTRSVEATAARIDGP